MSERKSFFAYLNEPTQVGIWIGDTVWSLFSSAALGMCVTAVFVLGDPKTPFTRTEALLASIAFALVALAWRRTR